MDPSNDSISSNESTYLEAKSCVCSSEKICEKVQTENYIAKSLKTLDIKPVLCNCTDKCTCEYCPDELKKLLESIQKEKSASSGVIEPTTYYIERSNISLHLPDVPVDEPQLNDDLDLHDNLSDVGLNVLSEAISVEVNSFNLEDAPEEKVKSMVSPPVGSDDIAIQNSPKREFSGQISTVKLLTQQFETRGLCPCECSQCGKKDIKIRKNENVGNEILGSSLSKTNREALKKDTVSTINEPNNDEVFHENVSKARKNSLENRGDDQDGTERSIDDERITEPVEQAVDIRYNDSKIKSLENPADIHNVPSDNDKTESQPKDNTLVNVTPNQSSSKNNAEVVDELKKIDGIDKLSSDKIGNYDAVIEEIPRKVSLENVNSFENAIRLSEEVGSLHDKTSGDDVSSKEKVQENTEEVVIPKKISQTSQLNGNDSNIELDNNVKELKEVKEARIPEIFEAASKSSITNTHNDSGEQEKVETISKAESQIVLAILEKKPTAVQSKTSVDSPKIELDEINEKTISSATVTNNHEQKVREVVGTVPSETNFQPVLEISEIEDRPSVFKQTGTGEIPENDDQSQNDEQLKNIETGSDELFSKIASINEDGIIEPNEIGLNKSEEQLPKITDLVLPDLIFTKPSTMTVKSSSEVAIVKENYEEDRQYDNAIVKKISGIKESIGIAEKEEVQVTEIKESPSSAPKSQKCGSMSQSPISIRPCNCKGECLCSYCPSVPMKAKQNDIVSTTPEMANEFPSLCDCKLECKCLYCPNCPLKKLNRTPEEPKEQITSPPTSDDHVLTSQKVTNDQKRTGSKEMPQDQNINLEQISVIAVEGSKSEILVPAHGSTAEIHDETTTPPEIGIETLKLNGESLQTTTSKEFIPTEIPENEKFRIESVGPDPTSFLLFSEKSEGDRNDIVHVGPIDRPSVERIPESKTCICRLELNESSNDDSKITEGLVEPSANISKVSENFLISSETYTGFRDDKIHEGPVEQTFLDRILDSKPCSCMDVLDTTEDYGSKVEADSTIESFLPTQEETLHENELIFLSDSTTSTTVDKIDEPAAKAIDLPLTTETIKILSAENILSKNVSKEIDSPQLESEPSSCDSCRCKVTESEIPKSQGEQVWEINARKLAETKNPVEPPGIETEDVKSDSQSQQFMEKSKVSAEEVVQPFETQAQEIVKSLDTQPLDTEEIVKPVSQTGQMVELSNIPRDIEPAQTQNSFHGEELKQVSSFETCPCTDTACKILENQEAPKKGESRAPRKITESNDTENSDVTQSPPNERKSFEYTNQIGEVIPMTVPTLDGNLEMEMLNSSERLLDKHGCGCSNCICSEGGIGHCRSVEKIIPIIKNIPSKIETLNPVENDHSCKIVPCKCCPCGGAEEVLEAPAFIKPVNSQLKIVKLQPTTESTVMVRWSRVENLDAYEIWADGEKRIRVLGQRTSVLLFDVDLRRCIKIEVKGLSDGKDIGMHAQGEIGPVNFDEGFDDDWLNSLKNQLDKHSTL